ncbi:YchJ family protein [Tomitella fengzijianii]|uniref:UPF0225 protein FO059_15815 n=1 Tax=Tomitella fengzijianii TaxID=2597660 RepID=A0A516X618_9ACTN|nr:YchJ family metal-binding protein [Tomitella fengzijianii]QDQ98518.1 hypothetical protein FO059_15815 [Tomitella fengzijianii]
MDDQSPLDASAPCPCGFGPAYGECCGRFLGAAGGEPTAAPTAEKLMRSRYTAFVAGDAGHLLRTWHPDTRPRSLTLDPEVQWTRLTVLATTGGGLLEQTGTVEFVAQYRTRGPDGSLQRGRQHEHSRFVRVGGEWVYLDAEPSAS